MEQVCNVVYDEMAAEYVLKVETTISDSNFGDLDSLTPFIDEITFTPVLGIGGNKGGGKKPGEGKWSVADMARSGDDLPSGDVEDSVTFNSTFAICDDPRTSMANTVNALVTVKIAGGHKEDGWTSYCGDIDTDGDGYPDVFSQTDIGHLPVCQ